MQLASAEDRECIREAVRKGEGDFEHITRILIASGALEKCANAHSRKPRR